MFKRYELEFGGKPLVIETGKMAKQAHGACTLTYGDTVVLVTACRGKDAVVGADFMPLTVNYSEMNYAAGKIPGGFFKREGRPSEKEVLGSRLIDRPLRPMFPEGYRVETQIIATVMSIDSEHDPEVIAMLGASFALSISDIPFNGPIACVRVGKIDGKLICNPSLEEQKAGDIDLLVAGANTGITMVEGGANYASEDELVEAINFAQESMKDVLQLQVDAAKELGKTKLNVIPPEQDNALVEKVSVVAVAKIKEALQIKEKLERYSRMDEVKKEVLEALSTDSELEGREKEIKTVIGDLKSEIMRETILSENVRVDGRDNKTVRGIDCEVSTLPRTHGSALFTRGETQSICIATLGTADDEQRIDALTGWEYKRFMLHYNFPPFCVGEARFLRGPGRREIGHGALAERAVRRALDFEGSDFPYTVRIVSDILESNGSSSM
ncbi:MAG: polyribonucleotide nucleotidyltransferase, partial [Deltaproteobacteria bacterium]|nr:polyribonucleotide nucleotidyltransferase [Deltaproteobacteria bacterium]